MKSEGRCTPGGPLEVPGIKPPTKPVVHQRPTAMDRPQSKETKK